MSLALPLNLSDSAALAACHRVAGSTLARAAYSTYVLACNIGWSATLAGMPRSTYFKHLAVLRRAGLEVPGRAQEDVHAARQSGSGPVDPLAFLQRSGGLLELPGRRFQVVRAWDGCTDAGQVGTVESVVFRRGRWRICFELDGQEGLLEDLPVRRFAECTVWLDDDGDLST